MVKASRKLVKTQKREKKKIFTKKILENKKVVAALKKSGIKFPDKKEINKSVAKYGAAPKKIEIKHVSVKNKKSRTFGKISGFFSESEEEKKTRLIEKSELKKELGAEESILMSNNSPYIFALMWLISEKRV